MLSQKNRNKSFVFEEELDQTQNKNGAPGNASLRSNKDNLTDSLEGIKLFKEKELVLKVAGEEYKIDKDSNAFFLLAPLLKNIKQTYDLKFKAYVLPKMIDKKHLDLFLQFLVITSPNNQAAKVNLSTCKKLINISMFFKSQETIKRIIMNNITPNIDKTTCLTVIKDYTNYIYDSDYKPLFIDLVENSIFVAARNIFYLINNLQEELFAVGEDSLEEIIERYFESVIFNSNIDHSLIMRIMMTNRKINDIFELLENERKRSITSFEKMYDDGLQPTIIWKIKCEDPTGGFYKESEEFNFENVSIILINYYDTAKDVYNMALKIVEIKDIEGNTDNDNLASDHVAHNQQFVISILSICEIKEINFKSKINFNCIFSNTKTKVLVSRIENFSKLFLQNGLPFSNLDYSLVIYFSISYNFSSVLTHICKNFYEYHSLNSIGKLSKNVINIILKNEYLNVRNEDEVLYAVMNWMNSKSNVNIESCLDVARNINWNILSLDGLLDFIISQSKMLLSSQDLQNLVIGEFSRRFKEEYGVTDIGDKDITMNTSKMSNLRKRSMNTGPASCQSQAKSNTTVSFTAELIQKLIKIASKYDTPYSTKSTALGIITTTNLTNNKSSDKLISTSRNFPIQSDESKSLHVNNTSPVTNVSKLAKTIHKQGTRTPPEMEIGSIGVSNLHVEAKNIFSSGNTSYAMRKQVSSPANQVIEKAFSQMHRTPVPVKKKIFQCSILSQSKDDKYSGSLKIAEHANIKSLINGVQRNLTPNDNIVRSIHRDRSENNLVSSKSRERECYSNEKKNENIKSSTSNNFHCIAPSGYTLNSGCSNSKLTFNHKQNEKNHSVNVNCVPGNAGHGAVNVKQISGKKGITSVRRIPNHLTNTIVIIKSEAQKPKESPSSTSLNKTHGMTKVLSYSKQGHAKSNPNLFANVKFIKKDSVRAKSASGLRL